MTTAGPSQKPTATPVRQVRRGEYGCDACDTIDAPKYYLVRVRPKTQQLLCPRCFLRKSDDILAVIPVDWIFEVVRDPTNGPRAIAGKDHGGIA